MEREREREYLHNVQRRHSSADDISLCHNITERVLCLSNFGLGLIYNKLYMGTQKCQKPKYIILRFYAIPV